MKKVVIATVLFGLSLLLSCGSENSAKNIEKGKKLFKEKACASCHKEHTDLISPSLKEIAEVYVEKNGDMFEFLRGNAKPIVDPNQFSRMKPNLVTTKKMKKSELKKLIAYIYSVE
jgi:cytochrome c